MRGSLVCILAKSPLVPITLEPLLFPCIDMTRFFLIFLLLVVGFFAVELTSPVQNALVIPFTSGVASVSVILMQLWDDQVLSHGKIIWDSLSGFSVSIEAGCNGVEASIVLIAAMLAYPAPWRERLLGIIVGIMTVQVLNLVRIITLFYLGQWNKQAFEWAHLYIWQALIMLDVLVVFLIWLRWLSTRQAKTTEPAGT